MNIRTAFMAVPSLLAMLSAVCAQVLPTIPTGPAGTPNANVVTVQGSASGTAIPVSGTFSATLSGFAPGSAYATPLSVTTTSSRVALPTGTVVVVYNTGANAAYVQLGNASVVATTSNDVIQPNSWMAFTVGSNVDLAAITASSTATLNISGGSGLPTGAGGGSSGGSGGTVTQGTAAAASGAWPVKVTDGTNIGAVKPASTAAGATDPALVVAISPNNTVAATQSGTWNIGTLTTITSLPALTAGSALIGKVGIDQTTQGTTNFITGNMTQWDGTALGVPTAYGIAPTTGNYIGVNAFVTNYQTSVTHFAELVPNNTTAVVVKASPGTLYMLSLGGIGSAPAYLKFYDATSATCGSGTPAYRFIIPASSTAANGAGSNVALPPQGIAFTTGITYCVTTGIADADTTAPAVSTFLVNGAYQ